MTDCKYVLPCGRCDKLGAPCEAIEYELEMEKKKYNSPPPSKFRLESISNECYHDWKSVGRLFGTKSRYTMYVCSKCNEESTCKTYQDENGNWITHIV